MVQAHVPIILVWLWTNIVSTSSLLPTIHHPSDTVLGCVSYTTPNRRITNSPFYKSLSFILFLTIGFKI